MTPAHLTALFGVGCAASTMIAFLAAAHPIGSQIAKSIYLIAIIAIFAGFAFDDGIYPHLNLHQLAYYALLGVITAALLIGGGLVWLNS